MTDSLTRFLAAYDAAVDAWPVPVDRLDLPSAFGTTRVLACGPEDGEPLVLLHGGGATAAVWSANAAELSRDRRVFAVDRIGEPGRSLPGGRAIRTAEDLYAWLDGVLDALGLERTDLCGHSYGGWIALTYALRTPSRVRRLVLLDPTRCFAGFRAGYLLRALPVLLRPTARRARGFVSWESGGAELDSRWLELYGLGAELPRSGVVMGRRPAGRRLREFGVPTLVLLAAGSRAHDSRQVERAAGRRLPAAETAVLPGLTHHGIPFTGAEALDRAVLAFLDRP